MPTQTQAQRSAPPASAARGPGVDLEANLWWVGCAVLLFPAWWLACAREARRRCTRPPDSARAQLQHQTGHASGGRLVCRFWACLWACYGGQGGPAGWGGLRGPLRFRQIHLPPAPAILGRSSGLVPGTRSEGTSPAARVTGSLGQRFTPPLPSVPGTPPHTSPSPCVSAHVARPCACRARDTPRRPWTMCTTQ